MSSTPDPLLPFPRSAGSPEIPISFTRDIDITDALRDYPATKLSGVRRILRSADPGSVITLDASKATAIRVNRVCQSFASAVAARRHELGAFRKAKGAYPSPRSEAWLVDTLDVALVCRWIAPDGAPRRVELQAGQVLAAERHQGRP